VAKETLRANGDGGGHNETTDCVLLERRTTRVLESTRRNGFRPGSVREKTQEGKTDVNC
jgi:hypothetical protein